ncbi:hypothetical protein TraAM80_03709 [Trypanosoma rangeli]|uniref:Uncharacterized protein n=1 Tax=Trypanosoma rangeli TaxID=5698 RepID=A0A3R7L3E7_TRYRA|nr:uncharacterized protein TraAM80_03709 [Trypanosoma rangeli]RNF06788.1 hypothetical protein TraAM80_03709 [Trypanosoma rangeli]|eukprot:RNF06788.1 hypothetical protein TraAM80_03709 [Trypanosoma rangeli]
MKFWVKAITDHNVQEQLLVKASNSLELMMELGRLLNTHVTWMSVSDFQTQVVEKLNNGAEILTVKVVTSKMAGQLCDGETSFTGIEPYIQHPAPAQAEHSQVSCKEDEDWPFSLRSPCVSERRANARPSTACQSLLITPPVDQICLTRNDLELILHSLHAGAYADVVSGCFVRIRERKEYALYQIIRISNSVNLLLDMIHYEEVRPLEAVSNAPPVTKEVNTWSKKMISASRPFMAPGFVEAKLGDLDSLLRAARTALQDQVVQTGTFTSPTPPAVGRDPQGRRRHLSLFARSRMYPYFSLGRLVLKINDVLLHAQIHIIEEPEADSFDFVLFATRHSNSGSEKVRLSDFAGCMIELNKGGESPVMVSDRDMTVKGYEVFCAPQKWDCQYVALGRIQPSFDNVPYFDESKKYVQKFTVLTGRFLTGLFNLPTSTALPIPTWAQTEGVSARIIRPHLVVHREQLHVFYLVRIVASHPPLSSNSSRVWGGSLLGGVNVSGDGASIGNGSGDDKNAADAATTSIGNVSYEGSFAENSVAGVCRYGLAHAVSTDPKLRTWKLLTEKEPLFPYSHFMPVFTAASISPFPVVRDSEDVASTPLKTGEKVLQLLWHEEDFASRQAAASTHRYSRNFLSLSPNNSNRVLLPFEHLVNTHEEALPEHWVQEPCYSSMRTDVDSLRVGVASLSLCEHDGATFAACVQQDVHQNSTLTVLPVMNGS